jgi:ElaA protein
MSDLISRRFDELTVRQFHDIARLRSEVFVVEQDCVYLDLDGRDIEPDTTHHWIEVDGAIGCYARTLKESAGKVRIGRIVTSPTVRSRGLAASLVMSLIADFGRGTIVLEAQSQLADWYRRFGLEVVGDEYIEDGIPHVPMRREPIDM